jgi:hypothetical protein
MEFKNLTCANCGGTDFKKLSDLEYRCNHCNGLLISTTKAEPVSPVIFESPPVTEFKMPEFPGFAKVIAITFGIVVIGVIVAVLIKSGPTRRPTYEPVSIPRPSAAPPTPTPAPPKLKVEMVGKASDRFGDNFIKCTVTNLSDVVIIDPYVRLALYKGDVKLDTISGDASLKYLKPGVTVPIWASVGRHTDYTRAEVLNYEVTRSISNTEKLFPEFNYLDASMKVETGISTFNGQPYKEKFYEVSGTVENDRYEKSAPVLFVIFYNAKNEIVGAETANPPEMKRGEKGSFDVSAGETQLYGTPVRYEIMAVDPNLRNSWPCLVNKAC